MSKDDEEDNEALVTAVGTGAVAATAAATTWYYGETWKTFFNESVDKAKKSATEMATGVWDKLGEFALGDGFVKVAEETKDGAPAKAASTFADILKNLPQGVATKLRTYCGDSQTCKNLVTPEILALLSVIGISVGAYLYVKFRGTKKEKAVLEKRLRDARRLSEETSDDMNSKSLGRRERGRRTYTSQLSDSFSEEPPKRRSSRRNRPSGNRRGSRYTSRRR